MVVTSGISWLVMGLAAGFIAGLAFAMGALWLATKLFVAWLERA